MDIEIEWRVKGSYEIEVTKEVEFDVSEVEASIAKLVQQPGMEDVVKSLLDGLKKARESGPTGSKNTDKNKFYSEVPFYEIRAEIYELGKKMDKVKIAYIGECGHDKLVIKLKKMSSGEKHKEEPTEAELKDVESLIASISKCTWIDRISKVEPKESK